MFNFHFLYPYTRTITHGFAVDLEDRNWRHPHQLPILCLLVRGRAMVTLFFAISGYVLSYAFLSQTETQLMKGFSRLSSLSLRRWMRLYLPATISMVCVFFATFIGAFDQGRDFQDSSPWLTGLWEQHPPRFENFGKQMKDFASMWWDWSTPFQWRLFYSEYDPHTWTIPVEFKASMVLFVMLLASAGLKQRWRTGLFVLVTVYCLVSARWDVAAFTGGALVAGIHLWETPRSVGDEEKAALLPTHRTEPASPARVTRIISVVSTTLLLVAALYVLSFPDDSADKTPGFAWLYKITPSMYKKGSAPHPYMFWHSLAGLFVIWSVQRLYYVNAVFCLSIPQYFGKISFAFYLVHGPLLHSAGFALQPKIFAAVESSVSAWVGALVLGWMTMLALSVIAAHLFWKLVDMPLVRFAKWFEALASRRSGVTATLL